MKRFLVSVAMLVALLYVCTGCGEIRISDDAVMYNLENGETVTRVGRDTDVFYWYSYSGTPEVPAWECPYQELIGVIPGKFWVFNSMGKPVAFRWEGYEGDGPYVEDVVWVVTPA